MRHQRALSVQEYAAHGHHLGEQSNDLDHQQVPDDALGSAGPVPRRRRLAFDLSHVQAVCGPGTGFTTYDDSTVVPAESSSDGVNLGTGDYECPQTVNGCCFTTSGTTPCGGGFAWHGLPQWSVHWHRSLVSQLVLAKQSAASESSPRVALDKNLVGKLVITMVPSETLPAVAAMATSLVLMLVIAVVPSETVTSSW